MEYDKECVCYSEARRRCMAITEHEFNKGHHCGKCAFRKTKEEYRDQTGRTYEEELKEAFRYERIKRR